MSDHVKEYGEREMNGLDSSRRQEALICERAAANGRSEPPYAGCYSGFVMCAIALFLSVIAAHANKAVINGDSVLEIDGKKTFVICFTIAPPPDGKAPNGKNAIAELADA